MRVVVLGLHLEELDLKIGAVLLYDALGYSFHDVIGLHEL